MNNNTDMRKVVYSVLLTQIHFGIYHYGEKLPTIEETSLQLCVSVDTARAAYLKLKEEGYITLSKNVGAMVKIRYSAEETETFIQTFFSVRKNAVLDLGNSMLPLFGNAQWIGLKHAPHESLHAMEQLFRLEKPPAPYAILDYLNQKYSPLGNTLLMRLVWQIFMFLHDPFFCIEENLMYFDHTEDYMTNLLPLWGEKDWTTLRVEVDQSLERLSFAISQFYEDKINVSPAEKEITFTWSSYKKSHQLCYSLAMELLISISRGVYPVGTLLPSQKELAKQKGVSLSTVRRALDLLGSVGAIKSAKYVGTLVLPFDKATENSDFTNPVLHRRLVDMIESLHILALSCKDVSLLTLNTLDSASVEQLYQKLFIIKKRQRGDTLSYFILNLIAECAPCQSIRTIYSELLRQFFWAYALRGVKGYQESIITTYAPHFDALIGPIEKRDFPQFSANLEVFIIDELRRTIETLSQLGITGAENLLIPDIL